MGDESQFISINERAYRYIRQFSIKSLEDAAVELITNAFDAYRKTSYIERYLYIDFYGDEQVRFTDRALGLDSATLQKCFLQVGNFTAEDGSRGFFSRGAKDISAIADLTFNAVKDGKYSQCILDTDAYGLVTVADQPVSMEQRTEYNIPDPFNGLTVVLDVLQNFRVTDIGGFYENCLKLCVLRDIVSNPCNYIILRKYTKDTDGNYTIEQFNKRVLYVYPTGELILDLQYNVPGYDGEIASMRIYKTQVPIAQPVKESMLEFGFLIKDATSVYCGNTIDDKYRWNPYINYLYGYIYSDSIKKYLIEYDTTGATEKNPFPIIDPSRVTGVASSHPLIKAIYSIPLLRVDLILRELNKQVSSQAVTIEDMNDLLEDLTKYGLDVVESNEVKINFSSSYDGNLVKAINDDRAKYVSYEKSYMLANDYTAEDARIENYIKDQIMNLPNIPNSGQYYFLDQNEQLVQIQPPAGSDPNEPIDIMKMVTPEQQQVLEKRPYVYKLNDNGTLAKLYVFQRGVLDITTETSDDQFVKKQRQLTIEFINDLNMIERYMLDTSDGIKIKLNLNNPIVKKYMATDGAVSTGEVELFTLASISSTQSLVFLKEMFTDVLADLILDSDVQNGKIILDSTSYNNMKKMLEFRNKLVAKIELAVDAIFDRYVNANITKKVENITGAVNQISATIKNTFGDQAMGSLTLLKEQFVMLISNLVE